MFWLLIDLKVLNFEQQQLFDIWNQNLNIQIDELWRTYRRAILCKRIHNSNRNLLFQQLRGDLDEKNKEIEDLKEEKIRIQSNADKLDHSLTDQRSINDSLTKQLDTSNNAVSDLQKQFESQGVTMQQLEQEVGQKSSEITSKEDEIVKARLEITRSLREVEDLKKKMLIAEKSREDLQVRLGRMLFTFDLENI